MKNQLEKNAGISLIIGSVLGIITMVLHPVGGNIDHLINISPMIITSHVIALFSVPFLLFGFWGLSGRIGFDNSFSVLGFITGSLGLVAVLIAGAVNGLVVPFFVDNLADASPDKIEMAELVLSYGFALNQAFDYIFIGAICEAFLIWSIAIMKYKVFAKWIAFLGILLGIGFIGMLVAGFVLVDLHGFRIFIFGIVAWMLAAGIMLQRSK
ncbi:hypothetical protein [Roseivirga sp. E12]|uniref:hypothetical protein n=1 Tax=Roseivirga sp. E12 TaxID=2819237 RepID=UPI001ABC0811|nr:hypothetical protein [Roseivirga sp. E12]MBO3699624.1 hypothetical protein [Roseivirga sp. E12]